MKGTVVDGSIAKLLEGKIKNYISCINVEFESSRIESFYDLSLNVKGCSNLYEAFDKYVETEKMEGDNKYMAEGHGLQDATKGLKFTMLPPVLHLQLKRFEYDPTMDRMVKVNDRFEFYERINLDKYLEEQEHGKQAYVLHSMLIHSGDVNGGHYYAYIRPRHKDVEDQWFKFDDERVTIVAKEAAFSDSYGGEEDAPKHGRMPAKRFSNAYMLVYVREHQADEILRDVTNEDIPMHLRERMEREKARALACA